ncbi:HET-domain-containing protein [Stipitochalara longipes BDJ]|nr:HET-domain-containing protein [Stipitochalara longipes BDJ]
MNANSVPSKAVHPDHLYHPLNSDTHEIRVLRIEPLEPDAVDIRCSLEIVSLNTAPVYQALSYEWGPPDFGEPSRRVLLNSHEVVTTPNLRLALAHLETGPFYWIDALCIDQSNDKERGHQVRLMTKIYHDASAVVAWLGLEAGSSGKGMEFLNEIEAVIAKTKHLARPDDYFRDWLYDTLKNEAYRIRWDGLQQIFKCTYWSRLWVVQELVVSLHSDQVWLLCGSSKARFGPLGMFARHLDAIHDDTPSLCSRGTLDAIILDIYHFGREALGIAIHAEAWRSLYREKERNNTILALLSRYPQQLCADPRDKIYALLGVSVLYPNLEFPITYTIPVLDVYKNFARYVIAGSKSLNILKHAGYDQCSSLVRPSWVPNWQSSNRKGMIRVMWSPSGALSIMARYSADGNILITQAYILGDITRLLETGTFYSKEIKIKDMDSALAAGRKELYLWLEFITRQASTQNTALSAASAEKAYELLFYVELPPYEAERELPFENFHRLCEQAEQVSPANKGSRAEEDRVLYRMRDRRQLCSIDLAPLAHGAKIQDLPGSDNQKRGTTVGLCSRNARIGDVVTVVRGCMNPILLRQVEDGRYEIVGVIYVYGFMKGEALERFEEVEIELV